MTEARIDDLSQDFVLIYATFGEDVLEKLVNDYQKASAYLISIVKFAMKSGLKEYG
ncbi:hypothetical protein HOO54_08375 [Bacillus sp. WMMC1349]|uniref:hypothetical protein n=1 Tax=Bacillus sp. WMMC1349 TaxID=2736254 RepID=UPI001551FC6A|nr:hypothetical protein [Bacillus sp. WMMC1349]NPC92235.1 hypothetical protein [Bacillus sp. WMMC1349]